MGWLLLALVTFLAPGVAAAALTRSRAPLETALLASYASLHTVVVALQLAGQPLTPGAALAGLLALATGLAAVARVSGAAWPGGWLPGGPAWGRAPACVLLVALAARSSVQALNGMDVPFRWGFLAECMLEVRSLDFYPPVTAADFGVYGFPDGMSPLVASGYWYVWAWAGEADPRLAAPLVALQWVCVCSLGWRLGARLGGPSAGPWAAALTGSCAFLVEVIGHGQEVGLMALAVLAGLHAVLAPARDAPASERTAAALEAGVALAVAALAREYGAAFLAPVLLAARRGGAAWRELVVIVAAVGALAAPWYVRNLLRTGNPLYDLPTAPLFPARTIYPTLVLAEAPLLGWSSRPIAKALEVAGSLLERAPLLLLVGLPGLARPALRPLAITAGVSAAIWFHSVQFTGGGLIYSTRVLAPAMALLAVAGGVVAAGRAPAARRLLAVLLVASTTWAAATALAAPRRPGSLTASEWTGQVLGARGRFMPNEWLWRSELPRLLPRGARILSANPYLGPALRGTGYDVVTIWSPEVAFLFAGRVGYAEAQQRLAARGIVAYHAWDEQLALPGPLQRVRFFAEASRHARPLSELRVGRHRMVALPPARGQGRAPPGANR